MTRLRFGLALPGALLCAGLALAQPAAIAPGAAPPEPPITSPRPPGLATPELIELWRDGIRLERRHEFLDAAAHYEAMTRAAPQVAYSYWKISRNYWRYAEGLPPAAKAERLAFYQRADGWATQGLAVDSECAECMLWKFGAMGRIGTTRGVVRSVRMAPEMEQLLERGIALRPTYKDDFTNSTLGNLYYAGAVFYRVVPEWIWLDWLIGVRGDIEKSLDMIRQAALLDRDRIDYQVEMGAILLCYAERRGAEWARVEGQQVLEATPDLRPRFRTDEMDLEHAARLLASRELACGFSRDGWIDIEAERKQAAR